LRENIDRIPQNVLARHFGYSKVAVRNKCKRLGIGQSPVARERFIKGSQFQKGQEPWSKGLKGLQFNKATQFKKGNIPHNTKYDGCISLRRHNKTLTLYIRISKAKWMLLNRYNWEKVHGKIPPRHIIAFKDGNTLNCDIENLVLMSRAENSHRNRNIEKEAATRRRYYAEGRYLDFDRYIAYRLYPRDAKARAEALKHPEILELKRLELKLAKGIKDATG